MMPTLGWSGPEVQQALLSTADGAYTMRPDNTAALVMTAQGTTVDWRQGGLYAMSAVPA